MRTIDQELIEAVCNGNHHQAKELIENGADVNIRIPNDHEYTASALYLAIDWGHVDCVRVLLERGAVIAGQEEYLLGRLFIGYGSSPAERTKIYELLRLLLEAGIDPNVLIDEDQTALRWAASNGMGEDVIALLRSYGGHE